MPSSRPECLAARLDFAWICLVYPSRRGFIPNPAASPKTSRGKRWPPANAVLSMTCPEGRRQPARPGTRARGDGVPPVQFLFEDFVLDLDRRELTRGSPAIAIGPQVFGLRGHLVQNREHVVSKDDLLDVVCGGRIVSESTLTSHIN